MRAKKARVAVVGLAASALAAATVAATATPALADYGAGTAYQVEISAELLTNLGGPGTGAGLWYWFALTPAYTGASYGTADYQGADCIHHLFGAPTGSTPEGGSNVPWTDDGTDLIIGPFATGAGPQIAVVPDTIGHTSYSFVGEVLPNLPLPGNVQVQVAP